MPSVKLTGAGEWANSIHSAQADDFWVWTLIGLGIGLLCGYGIFYFVRRARILEDTPTSKIRSAHQGYVEIIGEIEYLVNQPVIAPLTQKKCAWFSYQIDKEERSYSRHGSFSRWRNIEKQTSERPFQCKDDTGSCMINPKGAEVIPSEKDVWYGNNKIPSSPHTTRSSFFSGGRYRYIEKRLHVSQPLYAIGQFYTVDPNKAHGEISDEVRAVLNTWKKDQENLLNNYDSNGDGEIDLKEWEQVRQAATQHVIEQRLNRADRPAINIMAKTDDFRRPYILSVTPQRTMVRDFRLKAIACTIGFIALTPVTIWMLFIRLSG